MALLYCTHSAFYIAGRRLFNLRGFRWKWQRAAWLWQSGEQRSTLGVITDDSDGFISSVQFGHSVVYDPMDCSTPGFPVHHQLLEPAQTHSHQVSNAIQPSHPLSSPPPALNLSQHQGLQMSQFFASGGQRIGVSASASVLPMNIQDWSPLGWTGWISLHSKGISRVFSNTTVEMHQFFGTQLSL